MCDNWAHRKGQPKKKKDSGQNCDFSSDEDVWINLLKEETQPPRC